MKIGFFRASLTNKKKAVEQKVSPGTNDKCLQRGARDARIMAVGKGEVTTSGNGDDDDDRNARSIVMLRWTRDCISMDF